MEPDIHFARLLNDLPKELAGNNIFINDLINCAKIITVKKGDYLLRSGEICHGAYFINKGLFLNFYISDKGNETVTGFSSDYQYPFLSAIGYFSQTPSEFEIKAIEDGELISFSRADIENLSLRYPLFASYYQHVMLIIISKLYSMFAIRQSSTAEEFMQYMYDQYDWLIKRVPDKYLAQFMGVSTSWYCKLKRRLFSI